MDLAALPRLVEQTDGASAAFLRELVRTAALSAAVHDASALGDSRFDDAPRELEQGGRLTRSILGAGGADGTGRPVPTGFPKSATSP